MEFCTGVKKEIPRNNISGAVGNICQQKKPKYVAHEVIFLSFYYLALILYLFVQWIDSWKEIEKKKRRIGYQDFFPGGGEAFSNLLRVISPS